MRSTQGEDRRTGGQEDKRTSALISAIRRGNTCFRPLSAYFARLSTPLAPLPRLYSSQFGNDLTTYKELHKKCKSVYKTKIPPPSQIPQLRPCLLLSIINSCLSFVRSIIFSSIICVFLFLYPFLSPSFTNLLYMNTDPISRVLSSVHNFIMNEWFLSSRNCKDVCTMYEYVILEVSPADE